MEFIDDKINNYAEQHTSKEGEILKNLNRETWAKVLQPRMLSGHSQGRFLSMISNMVQPERVLEIGTYTSYAAICLAEGLKQNGQLHTIEKNEELSYLIKKYIKKSNNEDKIISHIGDALQIIPKLNEDWDIVFIDADKVNYINYFQLIIEKMKSNSYIIADNVLWSGKVVGNSKEFDQETEILNNFNKMIQEDNRLENILLPIRDGLLVARVL